MANGNINMKTIEERRMLARRFYVSGANDQKKLTLEAFDEWLCRNSWITRDEGNRKPLEELRNIIQNI